MTDLISNNIHSIIGSNLVPSHFQFYDGDKIIKIGRDCSLELGTGWTDHGDAAVGFFKVVVQNIMPEWKTAERLEERTKIVAWLRGQQTSTEKLRDEMNRHTAGWHFADEHASSLEQSANAIERGEHMQEQSK